MSEGEVEDVITIGFYPDGGGTNGHFDVEWRKTERKPIACLRAFDGAWKALFSSEDIIEEMSLKVGKNITPDEFAEILRSLGIKDLTITENTSQ